MTAVPVQIAVDALDEVETDAVLELVTGSLMARAIASRDPVVPPSPADLQTIARHLVEQYRSTERRIGLAALDDRGSLLALLSAPEVRLAPREEMYTYAPPVHVTAPYSGWHVRDRYSAPQAIAALSDALHAEAERRGVPRVGAMVSDADWWTGSAWRATGMRADLVLASRSLAAPWREGRAVAAGRVRTRRAVPDHLEQLVDLALAEYLYHAEHTGSGVSLDQERATARQIVSQWFRGDDDESAPRAFVAEGETGDVVGVSTVQVHQVPADSPARLVLPARYAYIGLTSVVPAARGGGIGAAVAAAGLEWLRLRPEPPAVVSLHYAADNRLSAPFWSRQGFAPVLTTLTSAPSLRRA